MLETDSPYLTPKPFRGKRNEPAMIIYIADYIAQLLSVDTKVIAEETTKTAMEFFDLK